jgi:hypothetical protein
MKNPVLNTTFKTLLLILAATTADYQALNWTPDGKVLGLCLGMRPKIWTFQPVTSGR